MIYIRICFMVVQYGIGTIHFTVLGIRIEKEERASIERRSICDMDSITDGSNLVIARSISATKIRRRAFFILLLKHSYLVAFSS